MKDDMWDPTDDEEETEEAVETEPEEKIELEKGETIGPMKLGKGKKGRQLTTSKEVLDFLTKQKGQLFSRKEICDRLNLRLAQVGMALKHLKAKDEVTMIGKARKAKWGVDVDAQTIRLATQAETGGVVTWKEDEEAVPVIKPKRKYRKRMAVNEGIATVNAPIEKPAEAPEVRFYDENTCVCGTPLNRVYALDKGTKHPKPVPNLFICLKCKKLYGTKLVEVGG